MDIVGYFIVFFVIMAVLAAIINKNIESKTKNIIEKYSNELIEQYSSLKIKVRNRRYTRFGKGDIYLFNKFFLIDDYGFKLVRGRLTAVGFTERTPTLSFVQFKLGETGIKNDKLILKGEIEGAFINGWVRYSIICEDTGRLHNLLNRINELYLS